MKYEKDLAKKLLINEFTEQIKEYYKNKESDVNTTITCPNCFNFFHKKNKQHTFCQKKCKDYFWDDIVDERRDRRIKWNRRKYENRDS